MNDRIVRPVTAVLATLLALSLLASGAWAGTSAESEISDGSNDATPLARIPLGIDTTPIGEHAAMYDLTKGWVAAETSESFTLVLEVRDIDNGLDDHSSGTDLSGESPYVVADYHFYLTVHQVPYDVLMRVQAFKDGGLEANYSLSGPSGWIAPLAGLVDVQNDFIQVFVPKAKVGSPAPGDLLTRFWASSETQGVLMDAGPNAEPLEPSGLQPTDPAAVEPNFGANYDFGHYEGAWPPDFTLTLTTPGSVEVATHESATFGIRVANDAAKADTIRLGLKGVPSGWSSALSESTVSLGSGSERIVILELTPTSSTGASTALVVLQAMSTLGDMEKSLSVTAQRAAASGGGAAGGAGGGSGGGGGGAGGSGGSGDGDATSTDGSDASGSEAAGDGNATGKKDRKGSPAPGLALVVAAVALLALLRRRDP